MKNFIYLFCGLSIIWINACGVEQNKEAQKTDNQENTEKTNIPAENQVTTQSPQITLLNERITKDSTNAELYFTRANMHLQANNLQASAADFYKSLSLDSLNSTYYLAAADLFFNAEQFKVAIPLLEKGTALIPTDTKMPVELGKYYFYIKKYKDALKQFDFVIDKEKDNATAYFWKGMVFRDQKKEKQAIQNIKKAADLDTDLYNAHIILAQMYAQQNNNAAINYYEKAIKIDPASIEAHYGKALFLQEKGKTKAALAEYRQLISKNPQYHDAYYNMGYIHFQAEDYKKARDNFNIAIRMSPAYAKAYYMRGLCSERLGELKSAKNDYKQALNFDAELKSALQALKNLGAQ